MTRPDTISRAQLKSNGLGFTLVELLVVLLIVGLGISFVSVNVGTNEGYRLRSEARQFANYTALTAEEALLSNRQYGVDIYRQQEIDSDLFGYRWLVRNESGRWELAELTDRESDILFPEGVGLRLQLDGLETEQDIEFKQEIIAEQSTYERQNSQQESFQVLNGIINEDASINQQQRIEPEIWLMSNGEINAFKLFLYHESAPENELLIEGDVLGRISVNTGSEDFEE